MFPLETYTTIIMLVCVSTRNIYQRYRWYMFPLGTYTTLIVVVYVSTGNIYQHCDFRDSVNSSDPISLFLATNITVMAVQARVALVLQHGGEKPRPDGDTKTCICTRCVDAHKTILQMLAPGIRNQWRRDFSSLTERRSSLVYRSELIGSKQ